MGDPVEKQHWVSSPLEKKKADRRPSIYSDMEWVGDQVPPSILTHEMGWGPSILMEWVGDQVYSDMKWVGDQVYSDIILRHGIGSPLSIPRHGMGSSPNSPLEKKSTGINCVQVLIMIPKAIGSG